MKHHVLACAAVSLAVLSLDVRADVPPPYEPHGIGMELGETDDLPAVQSVLKGGPAEKAGVKKGDEVLAVDGTYAKAVPHYYLARSVRGEKGTVVELVLLREDRLVLVVKVKRSVRRG